MPTLQPDPAEMTILATVLPPPPGRCAHCGTETAPAERLAMHPSGQRVTHCGDCACDTCERVED